MDLHASLNEIRHPPADISPRVGLLAGVVVFTLGLAISLALTAGAMPWSLIAVLVVLAAVAGGTAAHRFSLRNRSRAEREAQQLRDTMAETRRKQLADFTAARPAERENS